MRMQDKGIVLCVLFLGIILVCGCETSKGAAYTLGSTLATATEGVAITAKGAAKDTATLWQGILRLDNWIKENLW